MNSLTRISRRKLCQELIIRLQSTAATSSSSDIYIPNRKERGPTDILKALESTISRDYAAPHYKFHDDPYLMPLSKIQNRSYALSREAGKKAAMWVRQEHSNLFHHKVAEPEIKAFVPPPVYTEKSKVTEETLLYEISNCNVSDAITIYDLLKVDITIPTKQALLELLCFYNNSQPINTDLLEYRWYQMNKQDKNTWISRPQINVLFDFLIQQEPKVAAAAYDAIICGLAKYFSIDKAWHLYQECQKKRLPLSVRGYNAMISLVQFLNREGEKSRTLANDIYKTMAENGVTPNIYTFNTVLNIAASLSSKKEVLDFTRNILADIEYFQLKPSLTTYYYLLRILNKFDNSAYNSFVQILRSLKKEMPVVQHAKDMEFFVIAMNMASRQFCNRQLGEAVNELLLTGDNYKFIGNNYNESNYYRAYLELILATENFDVFFKIYNKLVPHVTIPEPSVMLTILETLGCYAAEITTQYIPKIWSHMIMFGHLDRENLLECLLNLISVHCKPTTDSPLNAQFAEIALTIWDHIQSRNTKRIQHTIVNSTMMGDIAVLLVRGGNIDKTIDVIMSWTKSPHLMTGSVAIEHINEIFEVCLAQGHAPVIFAILEYVISLGLEEVGDMAKKFHQTIPLTSTQEDLLISLVGDILNLPLSKEQQSSANIS